MATFNVQDFVVHRKYGKGIVDQANESGVYVLFPGQAAEWFSDDIDLDANEYTWESLTAISHYKPEIHLSDKVIALVNQYEFVQSQITFLTNSVAASLKLHTLIEAQWQERFDAQAEELNGLRELFNSVPAELTDPLGFAKDLAEFNELLQQDDGLRSTLDGEPIVVPQ
jgi:hypothetical protein